MIKFEEYLQAVKNNVINELFNINTEKIKMNPILIPEFNNFSFYAIYKAISRGKTIEQMLSLNKEEIYSLAFKDIKKYTDDLKAAEKETKFFTDAFLKIKQGNYYINDTSIKNEDCFIFLIDNKIYELDSLDSRQNAIFITFNEMGKKFVANSIMSSEDGSKLFNKIRGIIEIEVPDWKNKVFAFEPKLEKHELKNSENIDDMYSIIQNMLKYFLDGRNTDISINLKKFQIYAKKIGNTIKQKAKKDIISNIEKNNLLTDDLKNEFINFIEIIFNGSSNIPTRSAALSKFAATKKSFKLYFDELIKDKHELSVGTSLASQNSSRTRLYTIIIRKMFGPKVITKPIGSFLYFSMSKDALDNLK